ncbi:phage tail protein [Kitasatospora sp. NPDC004669]|uniref:phage tail protein n=1 Tax=Kitasatospora sp. NPDC004669 TaxID=3154555 RepID=UPI0033A75196
MAISAGQLDTTSNISAYRFRVTVGEDVMAFNSASGLDIAVNTIEYQDGAGNVFQMPARDGLKISLKRGIITGQSRLFDWFNSVSLNQVDKKDVAISLTNESGSELLVTWNVVNAFPTSVSSPNLDASSNETTIEQLDLAAEKLTVEFH